MQLRDILKMAIYAVNVFSSTPDMVLNGGIGAFTIACGGSSCCGCGSGLGRQHFILIAAYIYNNGNILFSQSVS